MPRRTRPHWPAQRQANGEVTVRQFDPGTGWTLAAARDLLAQGYTHDHMAALTGYPIAMLRAPVPAQDVLHAATPPASWTAATQ
ncbi:MULTISPECIES: hypothetical protein [Protofrankia]|uniref:hypothetical protein n=1 Tax=Protofrankia TaxID=2994361 RepID=UPI00097762A1|nr:MULTISPECIES: hypothetical protein [Protofrankia]ONH34141.1 hypothetical protein BL254_17675 [Protofrankia sp. BMG5.30]